MRLFIPLSTSLSNSSVIDHAVYDNSKGLGAIEYNSEIDYFGIRVLMTPKHFLSLCFPLRLGQAESQNFDWIKEYIKNGQPIASPWLKVELETENKNLSSKNACVTGHEGRNRALAIQSLYGEVNMEVHITFGPYRARNLTPNLILELQKGLVSQTGKFIPGPLWK